MSRALALRQMRAAEHAITDVIYLQLIQLNVAIEYSTW